MDNLHELSDEQLQKKRMDIYAKMNQAFNVYGQYNDVIDRFHQFLDLVNDEIEIRASRKELEEFNNSDKVINVDEIKKKEETKKSRAAPRQRRSNFNRSTRPSADPK